MSDAVLHKATYADLEKVPEHLVAELVEGELYTWPRPAWAHAIAASALLAPIHTSYNRRDPGGWWIIGEPELHLSGNVLVPDIAGWRRERMQSVPARTVGVTIAPDWVCEILSPSTARFDRVKKLPLYAREGVEYAWIVDPGQKTVEVKRRIDDGWRDVVTFGGDDVMRAEPFSDLELNLADVWEE